MSSLRSRSAPRVLASLRLARLALTLSASLAGLGCAGGGFAARAFSGNIAALMGTPRPVLHKVHAPYRPEARLAVLWVGHATVLVQMDDKLILTDPVFTSTVAVLSRRLVERGLDPEDLPHVDAVIVSHMHFDHLSLGSLSMIEPKVRTLLVPKGGLVYVPNFAFPAYELPAWTTLQRGDLRITAVPVSHAGFRYGVDEAWMTSSFTGYVVEYHGLTVYFAGDTGYRADLVAETRARFPSIDLALIPIAPVEPHTFMAERHVNPAEAVDLFTGLGARRMMAIHFDTFVNSLDAFGAAPRELRRVMVERGLDEAQVNILAVGEQRVIVPAASAPR
jgi:N-acyl-phosphatidylethanolamine-hydrolysing phospholipase D